MQEVSLKLTDEQLTYKSLICIHCAHSLLLECHRARVAISEIVGLVVMSEWPLPISSRLKLSPDNFHFPIAPIREGESFGGIGEGRVRGGRTGGQGGDCSLQ